MTTLRAIAEVMKVRMLDPGRYRGAPVTRLVLYSRVDCHLCDVVKAAIERLAAPSSSRSRSSTSTAIQKLREEYNWEVPVLLRRR